MAANGDYQEIIDRHKLLFDLARMLATIYGLTIIDGLVIAVLWPRLDWGLSFAIAGAVVLTAFLFWCYVCFFRVIHDLLEAWAVSRSTPMRTALARCLKLLAICVIASMVGLLIPIASPASLHLIRSIPDVAHDK